MKRGDRSAVALLMATSAAFGACVYFASPAKSDPDSTAVAYAAIYGEVVCDTLDDYPSFGGIIGIGQALVEEGLSWRQAGQVIGLSAMEICPRHLGLVMDFANQGSRQTA